MLPTSSWCRQDLFFMADSIRRGSSFGEVAGFLSRTEEEVRRKAEELGIKQSLCSAAAGRHERRKWRQAMGSWQEQIKPSPIAADPNPPRPLASPQEL
jgi:hypothetical protein